MSRRVNRTLIGAFVIGALVVVVVAVLIFGSGKLFRPKVYYTLFFEGSVKGLDIGAPVDFKGTPIGQVSDITLLMDPIRLKFYNKVLIEITPGKIVEMGDAEAGEPLSPEEDYQLARLLIRRGLRAKLDITSILTGKLQVSFDFYPDTKAKMSGIKSDYPELPTLPSDLEELARKIGDIPIAELIEEALLVFSDLRAILKSPEIKNALANLDRSMEDVSDLVENLNSQIKPVLDHLKRAIDDYGKLASSLDSQLKPTIIQLNGTLQDASGLVNNLDRQIQPLVGEAQTALKSAAATLQVYGDLAGNDSMLMRNLNETLQELSSAARSLRALADYLERNPEALLRGKQ